MGELLFQNSTENRLLLGNLWKDIKPLFNTDGWCFLGTFQYPSFNVPDQHVGESHFQLLTIVSSNPDKDLGRRMSHNSSFPDYTCRDIYIRDPLILD